MDDPRAQYDDLLTARLQADDDSAPVSRLHLVMALRQATGLGLKSCAEVVKDYCERHDVLPEASRGTWVGCSLVLLILLIAGACAVLAIMQAHIASTEPHTRVERLALRHESLALSLLAAGLLVLSLFLVQTVSFRRRRRR